MAGVSSVAHRLTPIIERKVKKEYYLWIDAEKEVSKLQDNLEDAQKMLDVAERRRLADPRVKDWLEKLQDVTHDIVDALDRWEIIDHQQHVRGFDEGDGQRTWLEKVGYFILSLCWPEVYFERRRATTDIKKLNHKVDSLRQDKDTLLPKASDSQDIKHEITASFSDHIDIPCQQGHKKDLVNRLLSHQSEKPGDIQVISLVGMIGVGKTTLAQLIFNDPDVQSGFELKLWICVSNVIDTVGFTKAILQSLHESYPEDAQLQTLLELIRRSVSGRKFFLVLDHVRIEDHSICNQVKAFLQCGAPGSSILVTSRNEHIGNLISSSPSEKVPPLDKKSCWLLFKGIAFRRRSEPNEAKLEDIKQKIAEKCNGLPLAAKALGMYLQSRHNEQLWEDALKKEVWQLDEVAKALFAPIAAAYCELPTAVRNCFLCCATFPKDLVMGRDQLARLWMAQGYTKTDSEGWDYLGKLARNFFLQDSDRDSLSKNFHSFRVPRILHDFAQYVTKTGSKVKRFQNFYFGDQLPPDELERELDDLKSIRVLIVTSGRIQKLPPNIGKLIHLRSLDLSGTKIGWLPVTICNLWNLETLNLQFCSQLSELPKQIHKLKKLRHLMMRGNGVNCRPQGLEKLTELLTLDEFSVGRNKSKFGYLKELNELQGFMCINIGELKDNKDVDDAKKANLRRKFHISDLDLLFRGEEVRLDVMDALGAPPNLQRFCIRGYNNDQFPRWISTHLRKIRVLEFEDCNKCSELPAVVKLPFLEKLCVARMESLKRVGRKLWEDSSDQVIFPQLRRLEFRVCPSWEEWEDITEHEADTHAIMPRLEDLILTGCRELKALPNLLLRKATSFQRLEIDRDCCHLLERYRSDSSEWKSIFQNRQLRPEIQVIDWN